VGRVLINNVFHEQMHKGLPKGCGEFTQQYVLEEKNEQRVNNLGGIDSVMTGRRTIQH
jgi:predicted metalloprotease